MANHVTIAKQAQALVIPRTPSTENMFPIAKQLELLDEPKLAVPHGLRETIMLRHLGFTVPNPMLLYYDWRGGKPFSVQRATCDLMTTAPRCYILNSMGTGKTKATLWSWDYLYSNGLCRKMLVVATLSTLNFVWGREAFATLPNRRVMILHGTKKQRLQRLAEDADIYVINHDGLRTIQAELSVRTDIDVLCLDELAVYRNHGSGLSKEMRKFAERFKVVWGLTGRPMPNEVTDVWAQAKIIRPESVPKYFKHAQELLMNRVSQFVLIPKPGAVEAAFKMLQPSVRYDLDAVVELPEVVASTVDVPLSSTQSKAYKALAAMFKAEVDGKQITAVNAAVAMGKLLQVAGGWVYGGGATIPLDAKPRTDTLVDLINENERKVIVLVPYRHAIEGLSKVFDAAGVDYAVVHGQITGRDEIFNHFQNSTKYKVLMAHPECLAHGLTLTAADTIIWYMPITSLDIYEQANARITRVGQKHKQKIIHLQSTPVEKRIYSMLRAKQKIQDSLLDMLSEATDGRKVSGL